MTEDCEKICEMLIDYVNRNLTQTENFQVILHLSECENCRKETADIIAISKLVSEQQASVPIDIQKSAFDKIPQKHEKTLDDIINSPSPLMAFEIMNYVLIPAKKTLNLALHVI
jgi:anti-sigma factor ChrR (cupin superfamily)